MPACCQYKGNSTAQLKVILTNENKRMKEMETQKNRTEQTFASAFGCLRYIKGCLFSSHSSAKIQKDYMTLYFFCLLWLKRTCKYTNGFSMNVSSAQVKTTHLTMIAGSVVALRKRIRQLYWSIISQERKGEEGASYTCASLTSDKRIFQPTRVYRVTFTKAQACGSMEGAGGWTGDWRTGRTGWRRR